MSMPIACHFNALSVDQQKKYKDLRNQLKAIVIETKELPNGYSFTYPNEDIVLEHIMDFVILERICCPFLEFKLNINTKDDVLLTLSGHSETIKSFLKIEFEL
ncbi:hypothetical protein [Caldalkalibacillus salinus]|uniref:hypothetical protein n=1 Tax=Caldalkalibacillus salinus TaxID=2803787 RepID=UPI0019234EB2|nr:hypothetical protein [Caldalkalibacillus salinus]